MKQHSLQNAEKYTKAHRRKSLWYRVVSCMACVVVFCTVYALILPAVTLERTGCDLPAHTHTEACYTQVTEVRRTVPVCNAEALNIHQHSEACYDEEKNLICGLADFVVHTHTARCYDDSGNLWCPLPEIKAHQHTESCYTLPGTQEAHSHTDECYTMERGQLTCTEHVHTDSCYAETSELVCTQAVSDGHQHDDSCKTTQTVIACGLEESQGHQHGEGCRDAEGNLICGLEESAGHQHSESCQGTQTVITCGQQETQGHHHDDSCYETSWELTCGVDSDHQHTDDCYTWNQVLKCEQSTEPVQTEPTQPVEPVLSCEEPEIILHQHTDTCYRKNESDPEAEPILICDKTVILEHTHTDACFKTVEEPVDTTALTCTLPEGEGAHTHDDSCRDENGELTCQLEETEGHTHTALCYGTWELTCTMDEHTHSEACTPAEPEVEYICGKEPHTHDETCRDENGELTCGLEEHQHDEACQPAELTEEELAQVEEVIALIDALPASEKIEETAAAFDEAEDEDGLEAYLSEVYPQVNAAYEAYRALTDAQKAEVTNADKLMELEWIWSAATLDLETGVLTDDSAYVDSISISQYDTGTAPFDGDDQPGNDSSSTNMVVRTFDTVTYNIKVKYLTYENGKTFNDARVKLEFVLPVDVSQAEFDQTAMGWMEDPALTTETRTINGVETQCQVLTCYKHLLPSADHTSVVPGEFGENVTVNIKMMKNGDTIAPVFSAAMEYNTWDGSCETHHAEEKKTIVAEKITISAAPKYNVQIKPAFATEASMTYDFSSTSSQLYNAGKALNLDAGQRPGRIYTMGVTLQLYNDNASKQMRGIELPQGPITFDIKLSSKFQPVYGTAQSTTQAGTVTDVTSDYTPLVWSYGPQKSGYGPDRYTGMTTYDHAYGNAAPWNQSGDRDNGCYNGGTWTAVQNGNTVKFTVTDYQFDGVFPCTDAGNTGASSTYYNKATGVRNIGCFSAMELYIVQPYTNTSGTQVLDDFSASGSHPQNVGTGNCIDGSFIMTVEDVNLKATSVSGQALTDAPDSNANQGAITDDKREFSVNLKRPGSYEQRHLYSVRSDTTVGMVDIFGVQENRAGTCAQNGNDWAVIGTDFNLTFGGYAQTNGDDANKMCAAKWLLKFDPEAIELVSGTNATNAAITCYQYQFLYAVKPDGNRWTNDAELKNTSMFQLCYYSSIAEARTHGEIVGILVEARPKSTIEALPSSIVETYFSQYAKVKSDLSLANRRFIITEESMIWTVDNFTAAGQNIPSLLGNNPSSPTTLPQYTFYVNRPSAYLNGDGVYDNHVGGYTLGDTLLVLSYKASILKKVEQKMPDGKTDKDTYNLDADQRVIDFVLDPSVDYGGLKPEQRQTTTVTIVDRLPKYLYYRIGSSYFDGTYTQTSTNGGTQGTITGGVLNEPTVVTNADGTQTLTWVIPGVVVGEKMPLIHYSVNVGTKGDETKDVPLGTTNLTNTVEISATGDERPHSISFGNVAEEGVVLTRGTASSYGKYSTNTVVEPDGEIHYVIYYDNNATVSIPNIVMLDTMPRNGYFGNSFTGSYTVKSWKLNAGKCAPSSFTLYYTLDAKYAGKTLQEIPEDEIRTWTSVDINADGTVTDMNGKMPVAWALIGTLNAQEGVYVDLTIKLEPGESNGTNNVYHNMFSHGNTITTTEEHSVIRTLEGLTWMDDSADGLKNEATDRRISGVKVTLMKLRNGGNPSNEADYEPYHYQGDSSKPVVEIETGKIVSVLANSSADATAYELGRYKFIDLPAGTFAVKFEDGSTKISPLIASPANRGSNDTMDSDGIAAYNSDKSQLLKTVILDIDMPTAEQMNVILYESKYHDSGFYERGYELPNTGGAGTVPYTMGGLLLMTSAAFLLLYNHNRRRKEDSAAS